jgi:hypothetical protein
MSKDLADLIKVMAVTLLVFAVSTLAMLYTVSLMARYASTIPVLQLIGRVGAPGIGPMLADSQIFPILLTLHVIATGIALLLVSATVDMALLITAKAATVLISALLGYAVGFMGYVQINGGGAFNLNALLPAIIALLVYLVLSTWLSMPSLRRLNHLRFPLGILAILFGPLLLLVL